MTIIFNVFGWPFTSMVPVIGHDRLGLDPSGVGTARQHGRHRRVLRRDAGRGVPAPAWYGRVYVGGVTLYMVMLSVFGLVPVH